MGYLIAGVAVGPFTPGFVGDAHLASQLAEIGVILLMFGVGLHFSIKDLLEVRGIALPGAIVQIAVATGSGVGLALLWDWSVGAGVMLGLALSVASTVVLLRALEQRNAIDSVNGRIAVGWLIVEDLVMVLAIVLLPALAGVLGGDARGVAAQFSGNSLATALVLTLGKVAVFVALVFLIGTRLVPWLLQMVARTGSRELFTLSVLAVAVGIAYGSAELFGVSFALGAFFAGVVLSESDFSHQAAADSLPLQDAFAVLFFVSMGMLFDPNILVRQPLAVLAVVLLIVFGKSIAAFAIVLARGYPVTTALTVSASLAQIGEFSFILAGLGVALGLLPPEGRDLILAGAILSIALNPLVFATLDPLTTWIRTRLRLIALLERSGDRLATLSQRADEIGLEHHAIIVGYGRVGEIIGGALSRGLRNLGRGRDAGSRRGCAPLRPRAPPRACLCGQHRWRRDPDRHAAQRPARRVLAGAAWNRPVVRRLVRRGDAARGNLPPARLAGPDAARLPHPGRTRDGAPRRQAAGGPDRRRSDVIGRAAHRYDLLRGGRTLDHAAALEQGAWPRGSDRPRHCVDLCLRSLPCSQRRSISPTLLDELARGQGHPLAGPASVRRRPVPRVGHGQHRACGLDRSGARRLWRNAPAVVPPP